MSRGSVASHFNAKARIAGRVLVFATLLAIAFPVPADPPSHAPAHGWRKKNDPHYVGYTGRNWEQDYGIVGGRCNRDAIGTVLGGVVGGAIGSQIGDGSGRTVAIVLGTVIGAAIGHEIGERMDERDRACMGHALELAGDGRGVQWTNDARGISYVLTPVAAKKKDGACRSFKLQVAAKGGKAETKNARACRTAEGIWELQKRISRGA